MECIFLNAAMVALFVRNDMEQGSWTQEEYTINMTFPYDNTKVIQQGRRVAFRDPATNNLEIFEIRNVNNIEPEHYQQIIGEHIALAELSDEHINSQEITDKTPTQALTTVLTGTLWSVGNVTATNVSSCDISRGNVWQAIQAIQTNWNVYIKPRFTLNAEGTWITGRYLDIVPAEGTWNGVRLSVEKNMLDSSVVYDDSEVLTALYGYGGNVGKTHSSGEDTTEELTFADVVWTATQDHPAKPSGQTYLEDPVKTALYGRNGRARYGYYQNADIKDANVLLEKTWEALKQTSDPKISISGMVVDLYRLGYHDEPLKLHDTVIVEIRETGEKFEKEIIKLDVDLIDPTATRVEIGSYIPNIIYINRETDKKSGGGGGGGGRGMTNLEDEETKAYTTFYNDGEKIAMVVGTKDGIDFIKADQISLAINNSTGESIALIRATHIILEGQTTISDLLTGVAQIEVLDVADLYCDQLVVDQSMVADLGQFAELEVAEYAATWQSLTFHRPTSVSPSHYFMYTSSSGGTTPSGTNYGKIITGQSETTIHYLGR